LKNLAIDNREMDYSGFGSTLNTATVSPLMERRLANVALKARPVGLISLHPLPVFIFSPRGVLTPSTFVFLVAIWFRIVSHTAQA
jgi:hypothetical protein